MPYAKQVNIGKVPTSETEIRDLIKAWIAISFAVGLIISKTSSIGIYSSFILASITVGTAFLFHEIAHKIAAQRYGCFAEFRAFNIMLILSVLLALLPTSFIFIAPGAVIISGPVGKKRNGIISASGPAVNIVMALLFLLLVILTPAQGMLKAIGIMGLTVNSYLAMFNVIPFWIFDGKKILAWNRPVYYSMLVISMLLFFVSQWMGA